ncbi:50S ribosomal protein L3 [Paenibacillus larvae]|jgi:large subunit ribosomal protein L3|uniref:Large ribosomal subunit protein uL3 n=4 Tax=Paenibacillus larvae TaxID=1464 RepID=V9WCT8_9BACL|nr:50S ribosomal protein L3 [Paenibacillus larvae]AHD07540.1 50S ribosomal protein L3 [Paenibacillus larvae subsp. larvae DSM 25430]AQR78519.1 50S ribosomal protein L3 [Paenibacillus larvae subsp. larvae]ARF68185.1 50S ribosomal protein L3 [Paenibacillus larvae subsp. pulvifaciens]AVF20235.1 50S ribosomal protein L3 [Paenibacillus larvae subsp. larvae]AVG14101.1 50S ribosomal protein L3 [Paenibacillus larvae subsp. larvae DSM 25430]
MTKGILGKKLGMTQVFTPEGLVVPVTVIQAGPCVVLQKKDSENDGYEAIQVGFEDKKEKRANKPEIGHAKKANTTPKRYVQEFRGVQLSDYEVGQELKADLFAEGEFVDVTGTSKGKGFQGVIKRHNQSRGPMSHGSRYHRGPGSMGSIAANRVFKGKNLPGHMGHETVTLQNLQVIKVDAERNVILVKGSIPGPKNSYVKVQSAVKK